jgi:predicted MFS family arabinose efflux permease
MIRTIARAYRSAYAGLPRELWLLSAVLVVNRAGSMVLPFLSLYLTQVRGLPIAAAGKILALYGLGAIAGSYAGGWLSDRIGATRTQQIGLIGSGFGYLWLSVLDDAGQIGVAVLVLSVFVESYRPAVMADMAERAEETVRVRAFALLRLAANVGVGIGPAVGGYLALHSYRWLFLADALTCWLACLMLALMLDPLHGSRRGASGAAAGGSPWRDLPFLLLMSMVIVLASALFQFFSTLPVYYRETYGFREDAIGLLLALNPLIIVLFEMVLIRWVENRGRLALIGLGSFLTCGGLALMPLGSSVAFAAMTIAVWTTGEMLALPILNVVVADRAPPGRRGHYMGIYTMAFSLAFVFAPACGTYVYDTLGPDRLWFGIGVLGAVLWVWALALIRTFRRRPASDGR